DVRGEVHFDHVRFGYTPERTIIHDLNLHVKPGKTIAIVGPTGAGKTTIINLLMRFYDPQEGTITVDGHDICREVTRDSLRRAYTMVLQDTWLFQGTIRDNIAYGKEGATDEEIIAAAKAAKIHSFIEALPEGYQTVLSDDGVNISKGQKQLLTIARAMLADASMLILDEATSNVDSRTEIRIQEAMYRLMEGRTCFVIAHRLSTIKNADQILVVNGGKVTETGTHDELMAMENGTYARLFRAQFET
ncbi:MAG: ATP-binding cassette domain-containing protein, partial [Clostridia bacterium]|nr:ATP-binding cassette domain-containing protein [Clostridia bacterium]